MLRLKLFLQLGFEVLELPIRFSNVFDLGLKKRQEHSTGLVDSTIEIDGAEDRLKGIDQQRLLGPAARLFFASAQVKIISQVQPFGVFHEIRSTHEETLQLRKLTFGKMRMRPIQKITDQKTKHGVAQKLELFVIEYAAALLVCMRTVRESLRQQL